MSIKSKQKRRSRPTRRTTTLGMSEDFDVLLSRTAYNIHRFGNFILFSVPDLKKTNANLSASFIRSHFSRFDRDRNKLCGKTVSVTINHELKLHVKAYIFENSSLYRPHRRQNRGAKKGAHKKLLRLRKLNWVSHAISTFSIHYCPFHLYNDIYVV